MSKSGNTILATSITKILGTETHRLLKARTSMPLTLGGFIEATRTLEDSGALAEKIGIAKERMRFYRETARLAQINGLGLGFQELMSANDAEYSIEKLAREKAALLHARLGRANVVIGLRRKPTLDEVSSWIKQANAIVAAERVLILRDEPEEPDH